jgi:hypothetical protein
LRQVLIRLIESRLKPGPGLYTWEDATRQPVPDTPTPVSFESFDVDKPILVFIHGTASSARGSFGAFLTRKRNRSGRRCVDSSAIASTPSSTAR